MLKMEIEQSLFPIAKIFALLFNFFDPCGGLLFLTESELFLDKSILVNQKIRYTKGDFHENGIVFLVRLDKVFAVILKNGSDINVHHHFIALLSVMLSSTPLTPLLCSLADIITHRLHNNTNIGLPKRYIRN